MSRIFSILANYYYLPYHNEFLIQTIAKYSLLCRIAALFLYINKIIRKYLLSRFQRMNINSASFCEYFIWC